MNLTDFLKPSTRIQIYTPDRQHIPYLSLIEDVTDNTIVVDNPVEKGDIVPFQIGSKVTCSLQHENAILRFEAHVLDRKVRNSLTLLVLSKPDNINRVQRRQFFRLAASLNLHYRLLPDLQASSTAPFKDARTKDISGGGVRFAARGEMKRDDILDLLIEVPQRNKEPALVPCVGRVVVVKGEGKEKEYGIEFVLIDEPDREKIVKFVFEEQAKRRRKEMRWVNHLSK